MYIIICLLSFVVTLLTTPIVKFIALKFEQLDLPSGRKVHHQPMVRLGGVAIFGATIFSLFCGWFSGLVPQLSSRESFTLGLLILGGSSFFLIGLLDDLFDLSAFNRLWMQGVISAVLWYFGICIDSLTLPGWESIPLGWLSLPVTVIWIAGVVNAINWIDGLDGLATGVASISTITLVMLGAALSQPVSVLLGMALLGGLLGFLYYNAHPAKIFMGDGGAYFVGFILASLCIVGPYRLESSFSMVLPMMILAMPLSDMTGVILARLYRGSSPFCADNRHLHHRLLHLGFSHRSTVLIIYCLAATTGTLTLLAARVPYDFSFWLGLGAVMSLLLWQVRYVLSAPTGESDVVVRNGIWYSENL